MPPTRRSISEDCMTSFSACNGYPEPRESEAIVFLLFLLPLRSPECTGFPRPRSLSEDCGCYCCSFCCCCGRNVSLSSTLIPGLGVRILWNKIRSPLSLTTLSMQRFGTDWCTIMAFDFVCQFAIQDLALLFNLPSTRRFDHFLQWLW